ncbi:hypothetical protein QA645_18170 [Bradyrhizobium sp. CIAT3101]|uniref:hypothetical protein n=1 Tax=Bradyrhizobium sp. CIAT3101 TaxID=439387 RepID=UPI0024B2789F|nr:hypothetical protein [Bradyrhizobium sp. CIAT3101]WFU84589.1 hypothetical protein QA645_18170 [Bradyrhizobium sp. CIAT3101]
MRRAHHLAETAQKTWAALLYHGYKWGTIDTMLWGGEMRRGLLMMAALLLTSPATAETLSWEGVGPIRLGMDVKAAEKALKTKLLPRQPPFEDDQCYLTWRADGKEPDLAYVLEHGRITVIQVYDSDGKAPDVADAHGLGIGSAEDAILSAYGPVKKSLGFYYRGENDAVDAKAEQDSKNAKGEDSPEYEVEVESPDHERSILFTTKAGKIIHLSLGMKPMVLEPEPCQ